MQQQISNDKNNIKYQKVKIIIAGFLGLLLSFVAQCVQAKSNPLLKPYQAQYDISYGGVRFGKLTRIFNNDRNSYDLTSNSQVIIPLVDYVYIQKSEGQMANAYPRASCYFQDVDGKKTSFCIGAKSMHALLQKYHVPPKQPLYDELSYQIALQNELMTGKKEFAYWILQNKKIVNYQLKVIGNEPLNTVLGKIDTVKIVRTNSGKRTNILWLAADYQYLPVAFLQTRPGKPSVHAVLTNLNWNNQETKANSA